MTGSEIEAGFKVIVGRPNLLVNIEKSITAKTDLEIADYIVGPMASAAIALNDEEKELGCAFWTLVQGQPPCRSIRGEYFVGWWLFLSVVKTLRKISVR